MYKAEISERAVPLHSLHHEQINCALNSFTTGESISSLGDKANVKLGPNESRAISFIEKQLLREFVTIEDKELINAGSTAIRRGKFQKLPREINKLIKEAITKKPTLSENYNNVIKLLKSYPLLETISEFNEIDKVVPQRIIKFDKPAIILSESFTI